MVSKTLAEWIVYATFLRYQAENNFAPDAWGNALNLIQLRSSLPLQAGSLENWYERILKYKPEIILAPDR